MNRIGVLVEHLRQTLHKPAALFNLERCSAASLLSRGRAANTACCDAMGGKNTKPPRTNSTKLANGSTLKPRILIRLKIVSKHEYVSETKSESRKNPRFSHGLSTKTQTDDPRRHRSQPCRVIRSKVASATPHCELSREKPARSVRRAKIFV